MVWVEVSVGPVAGCHEDLVLVANSALVWGVVYASQGFGAEVFAALPVPPLPPCTAERSWRKRVVAVEVGRASQNQIMANCLLKVVVWVSGMVRGCLLVGVPKSPGASLGLGYPFLRSLGRGNFLVVIDTAWLR